MRLEGATLIARAALFVQPREHLVRVRVGDRVSLGREMRGNNPNPNPNPDPNPDPNLALPLPLPLALSEHLGCRVLGRAREPLEAARGAASVAEVDQHLGGTGEI